MHFFPCLQTHEHHEKQPRLEKTWNWRTKAVAPIECEKENLDYSATLSVHPAERSSNTELCVDSKPRKKVTAAGAIWVFLTSGISKKLHKATSAFAVLNLWHANNTTYHIHTLTQKGEKVAEAELDFSSKDRLCGLMRGGAYNKNSSLRGVIHNKTVLQSQNLFLSLIVLLTGPPEQASEEEWASTAPSQCVHLWKKKKK